MPAQALVKMADIADKPLEDAERYWKEAKAAAVKKFGKGFKKKDPETYYRYVMGIVIRRLGLSKYYNRSSVQFLFSKFQETAGISDPGYIDSVIEEAFTNSYGFDLFNGFDLKELNLMSEDDTNVFSMEDPRQVKVNVYESNRGDTQLSPSEKQKTGGYVKRLEALPAWLPRAFKVTMHGGWLSPEGKLYPMRANGYDDYTLQTWGVQVPSPKWTLPAWAYNVGWVKISYYQSMGGVLNFSKFIKRRITFHMHGDTIKGENNITRFRIDALAKFYNEFFDQNIDFRAVMVSINEPKDGKVSIIEALEDVSPNPAFLSLFLKRLADVQPNVTKIS